jgi:heat shock protein HtpX
MPLLLAALAGLCMLVGGVLGGPRGLLLALAVAIPIDLALYRYSGAVALRLTGAHAVTSEQAPALHALVEELASYAHLPTPQLAIIDSPSANACVIGRDDRHAVVVVTSGLVDLLSRDELAGVLAHELSHVRNHDTLAASLTATLAGVISLLAQQARWSMPILAPLAATVVQLSVSRAREYRADALGARLHGNPASLIRALEKLEHARGERPLAITPAAAHLFIVDPLAGFRMSGLFRTHPPLAERIRRLRQLELPAFAV